MTDWDYDSERAWRQTQYLQGVIDGLHNCKDNERYDRGKPHPYHQGYDHGDSEYRQKMIITVDLIRP